MFQQPVGVKKIMFISSFSQVHLPKILYPPLMGLQMAVLILPVPVSASDPLQFLSGMAFCLKLPSFVSNEIHPGPVQGTHSSTLKIKPWIMDFYFNAVLLEI